MADPDDTPVDYEQRSFVNLSATAFLLLYALAFGWTVLKVHEWMQFERCVYSGRRDCNEMPQPARGVLVLPPRGSPAH